jgi:hypothetical protein
MLSKIFKGTMLAAALVLATSAVAKDKIRVGISPEAYPHWPPQVPTLACFLLETWHASDPISVAPAAYPFEGYPDALKHLIAPNYRVLLQGNNPFHKLGGTYLTKKKRKENLLLTKE